MVGFASLVTEPEAVATDLWVRRRPACLISDAQRSHQKQAGRLRTQGRSLLLPVLYQPDIRRRKLYNQIIRFP
jgi:hypothetical protein